MTNYSEIFNLVIVGFFFLYSLILMCAKPWYLCFLGFFLFFFFPLWLFGMGWDCLGFIMIVWDYDLALTLYVISSAIKKKTWTTVALTPHSISKSTTLALNQHSLMTWPHWTFPWFFKNVPFISGPWNSATFS